MMFADSGQQAVQRHLSVQQQDTVIDVQSAADLISAANYKRVALQFPDSLLSRSVSVYRTLDALLPQDTFICVLADTSYGSCCVDEVAANHVNADVLVHFGHACLSPTSRLPVIYVYPVNYIDVQHCVSSLIDTLHTLPCPKALLLRFDLAYTHQSDHIQALLRQELPPAVELITPTVPCATKPQEPYYFDDLAPDIPPAESLVFYIGPESSALTNFLITHAQSQVWSYDPNLKHIRLESPTANKLLMRRYVAVQKARDADVFGILIGTLAVASYLPMISHLRHVIKRARKKAYTVSVGKLNPSKLANLIDIDCFVLVACPENSIIDSKDFLRPIVTPFELELAFDPHSSWSGKYELRLNHVLDRTQRLSQVRPSTDPADQSDTEDADAPLFSLISGRYKQPKRYDLDTAGEELAAGSIALRNQESALSSASTGANLLQQRSFKGLEQRIGQDEPADLEQGRSGIARDYGE